LIEISGLPRLVGSDSADRSASGAARLARRALRLLIDRRVILTAVCALGLILRLRDLGQRSLWFDELTSVGIAAQPLPAFLVALSSEANMALYYWGLFLWLRLVGVGADETLLRLPSVLLGALAVGLIYALGRRLHSARAGLAAAFLLAVNGFHVALSQEARGYAALASLTILSYFCLDRALERGRRRDWELWAVFSALAFYCHMYTVFVIGAQGLFVLSCRSRRALTGLALGLLLLALLLLPTVPFFILQPIGTTLYHLRPPNSGHALSALIDLSGGTPGALVLYTLLAGLGVLRESAGLRQSNYRNVLLLTWLLVPFALGYAISQIYPMFMSRYLLGALPAAALLAGVGLARCPRPVMLTVLALTTWFSLQTLPSQVASTKGEPWREAVSFTLANARRGDGWIFISKWAQHGFERYGGWDWGRNSAAPYRDILEPFDWSQTRNPGDYRGLQSVDALAPFAARHRRIWLIQIHNRNRALGSDAAEPVRLSLAGSGYIATKYEFEKITILRYERSTRRKRLERQRSPDPAEQPAWSSRPA
jgi:hypothetical protein